MYIAKMTAITTATTKMEQVFMNARKYFVQLLIDESGIGCLLFTGIVAFIFIFY